MIASMISVGVGAIALCIFSTVAGDSVKKSDYVNVL
jgi:hypothetical protein